MDERLLIRTTSAVSGRTAVVSEEDDSVWLYLTAPGSNRPERDCWLFNKPSAPSEPDMAIYRARSAPPPAPARFIVPAGVREPPDERRWTFAWSPAGDAVVVAVDGLPIGFASMGESRGLSRFLARSGPWGAAWDEGIVGTALNRGG